MVRPRPRRRAAGQRGFTLVELLIAVALSTVGLLGLLALQMIAINGNMMSRDFGEAIGIAQERLEVAARTPYASLPALAETATASIDPTTDAPTTTSSPQAIYTRTTTVTANADATTDVQVVVTWNDARNRSHAVTLVTKRSP